MFVKVNNDLVNVDYITKVSCHHLEVEGKVYVHYVDGASHSVLVSEAVDGQQAIDLIMALNPAILEGKRLKFIRNAWACHNIVGHVGLQLLAWLKLPKLGMKLHDMTVPRPKNDT